MRPPAQMRMHPSAQARSACKFAQKFDGHLAFSVVEALADLFVQFRNDIVHPTHLRDAGLGQAHIESSPVEVATVPSHPPSCLQFVDQPHHVVAMNAQRIRELLLGPTAGNRQITENAIRPR